MPQVIVNKEKWKEAIEGLEVFRRLAKQVLSQLSYTPTDGTSSDSKAFAPDLKLRKPTFCPLLCQNCVKTPVARTLLCQNYGHLIGPAIDFVQCFPFHL